MNAPIYDYDFDPVTAVDNFRKAMAALEAATTQPAREEWQTIGTRLREQWAAWQGEDSLHEMAFGEYLGE